MHPKKILAAAVATVAIALGIWLLRDKQKIARAHQTARIAVALTPSPASPATPTAAPSPAAVPSSAVAGAPPGAHASVAAPAVFGARGPVTLAQIPPGVFCDQLLALPPAARERALESLARLRVPFADVNSLHVDADGMLFYTCARSPSGEISNAADSLVTDSSPRGRPTSAQVGDTFTVSVPISSPPARSSRSGAAKVIYLDFNGHIVTGMAWNAAAGAPASFVCTPYDTDGNAGSFNIAEQTAIVRIWERVAEDYAAFDVNVTTEEPAVFNNLTARVVFTKNNDANGVPLPSSGTAGGVAYLNTFGKSNYATYYAVAFAYEGSSPDTAYLATTASHEVGHNMGLSHDGTLGPPVVEYYAGHGTGETSWAPIMGSSSRSLIQWSKGEYFNANNAEDDLAIIAGKLAFRTDDHGNTPAAATPLIANGASVQQRGTIESSADSDYFSFTTAGGAVSLTVAPLSMPFSSNKGALDAVAELYDQNGALIQRADPAETTSATISQTLATGTYFLRVAGTGFGTPLNPSPTGYTAYASIGTYAITGAIVAPDTPVAAAIAQSPANQTVLPGNPATFTVIARGNPATSYQWQRSTDSGSSWQDLANDSVHGGATTAVLTVSNTTTVMLGYRFRCVATNTAGSATSASATLSVITPPPPTAPVFAAIPITSTFGRGIPAGSSAVLTAALTGGSDPITFQWRLNGTDLPSAIGSTYFKRNWQPADAGLYTVVATNPAAAITSSAYPQNVLPEGGWLARNPTPTENGLTRAAYLNGLFLVGGLRGTLLVSADGINWTLRTVPAANNLFSFHYINGLYLALGSLGAVFTSPDTISWTPRNSGTVHPDGGSGLQDMALGNGRLVAVGIGGLTTTSIDGINWTPGTAGTTEDLTGVVYAFGRFHAVSTVNGRVYSTADGVSWTSLPSSASYLRRIAFGAGRLVAVGTSGETSTSTDGLVWIAGFANTTESFVGINFVNNQFIATGTGGVIRTSPDGLAWTARTAGTNASVLQNAAYGSAPSVFNGQLYVIPGQSGTTGRALLTSSDSITWTDRITGVGAAGTTLRSITAGANSLVAVGNTGTVAQSVNGTLWFARASGTTNQLNDIAYSGTLFVAVGATGKVVYSSDGISWSTSASAGTASLNGVTFANGLWVTVGDSGRIYTSTTSTSWTPRASGTSSALNKVAQSSSTFVAVGAAGTILSSANGTTWAARSIGSAAAFNAIAYGNGLFVAVGAGIAYTSPDGISWTNSTFTSDTLTGLAYVAGRFVATGPGSNYFVSADGVSWIARFTGAFDPVYSVAQFGDQLYAVGDNSIIIAAGAPVITAPAPITATAGTTLTLAAAVNASAFASTYQWQRNGVSITGATSTTLTLAPLSPQQAGDYALVATNALGTTTSSASHLTVAPPPPIGTHLVNLSIRSGTGAGSQTLIVGFVIDGYDSKSMLLRGVGPTLTAYGVTNALADPFLRLFDSNAAELYSNDDWGGASALSARFAAVGAFALPTNSKDAALSQNLSAGRYTYHLTSTDSTNGVALAELYDADTTSLTAQLVNLSARTQVGTGDNILIAGFVLSGSSVRTVLIRGLGPTLATYGVTGVLADPQLALFQNIPGTGNVFVTATDDWGGTTALKNAFAATGAVSLLSDTSKDAALLVTLQPGIYSAQVSGVNNTTGVALVEVYLVP